MLVSLPTTSTIESLTTRLKITYEELSSFTEVMAAGTAASLVPIKSITMRSRKGFFEYQGGGDEPGPACLKLLAELKGLQQGKSKDSFGWCEHVSPYKPGKDYEVDGVETHGVNGKVISQLP